MLNLPWLMRNWRNHANIRMIAQFLKDVGSFYFDKHHAVIVHSETATIA